MGNGVGVIDADYYNNPDNEGEIFFQLINLSPYTIQLKKGDIIGQGIIKTYEITDDDNALTRSFVDSTPTLPCLTHVQPSAQQRPQQNQSMD